MEAVREEDAESVEVLRNGEGGIPVPSRLVHLGECRKLSQRVRAEPQPKTIYSAFRHDIKPLVAIFVCDSFPSPFFRSLKGFENFEPSLRYFTVLYFKMRGLL